LSEEKYLAILELKNRRRKVINLKSASDMLARMAANGIRTHSIRSHSC